MKKCFILTILLLTGMIITAQVPWNGSVADAYDGGEGTPENPYQIATAEQLALLASEANNGLGGDACYSLTNDINLNAADSLIWTPIGNGGVFKGVFDGNGHVISDLYVDGMEYSGLFARTENATIRNVQIENALVLVYVQSYVYTAQAGIIAALAQNTNFYDCSVSGVMGVASTRTGGGIVGSFEVDVKEGDTIQITNCVNNADIYDVYHMGGIVGSTSVANGSLVIENCVNNGKLKGLGFAGGMIGEGEFIIRNCENYGEIVAQDCAGGMVGQGGNFGTIVNCLNHESGTITAECAGGIIGASIYTEMSCCGNHATITGVGTMSTIFVGGIAGADGSFSNCYNLGTLQGDSLFSEHAQIGGITGTCPEKYLFNVYNAGAVIVPEHADNTSIYGIITPAVLNDTVPVRNCYWHGEYTVPACTYYAPHPGQSLPGSCAFHQGTCATSWWLEEEQYGTADLVEALNAGAMDECVWKEDLDGVNGGFPLPQPQHTIGVEESGVVSNPLHVYPNPTNGMITVETQKFSSLPQGENKEYRIVNMRGQTVMSGSMNAEIQQIDVSRMPDGIYFVCVGNSTIKLIVKK